MWNPFAKDAAANEGGPSMVPPSPGLMPPAGEGQPVHLPPEQTGGAIHPAARQAAASESAGAIGGDEAARNRIADVQLMGTTAVATVTVTELSHDSGAHQLADLLTELADTGAEDFILDLHAVQFMDSACLGCLVEALNRLAAQGGRIALANGNHSVQYLFRLTRLDRVFVICPDVMSALQQMERRRAG
jgi:anti-sigma B factor antagonist